MMDPLYQVGEIGDLGEKMSSNLCMLGLKYPLVIQADFKYAFGQYKFKFKGEAKPEDLNMGDSRLLMVITL